MLNLRTKVFAGVSSLVMAGSMMIGVAAPAARAAVASVGSCQDSVLLLTYTGMGLGDQTAPVKSVGNLAKDKTTGTVTPNAGSCTGMATRIGDLHVPGGSNLTLTPKSETVSLSGNASCAAGAMAQAADATAANAYPLNGKITWTFTQTYNDLLTGAPTPYKMQAEVSVLGFPSGSLDVVDVGGIVLSGVDAGATVVGSIWEDPVSKTGGATGYNTGYELDLLNVVDCAEGVPDNALITTVMSSGGGTHSTSLLGGTATGLAFQFGTASTTNSSDVTFTIDFHCPCGW